MVERISWNVKLEYPVNWELKKAFFVLPTEPTPHYFTEDVWVRVIEAGTGKFTACVRGDGEVMRITLLGDVEGVNDKIRREVESAILEFFGLKNVGEFYRFMESDEVLKELLSRFHGFGRGGRMSMSVYEGVVKAVLQQQISFKVAERIAAKMVRKFGCRIVRGVEAYDFPEPEKIAELKVDELKSCGMSSRKAECIIEISKEATANDFEEMRKMSEDEVFEYLTSFKGVGRWTAELVMCTVLDFNAIPADDLGIRRAVSDLFFKGEMQKADVIREFAQERFGKFTRDVVFYLFLADRLRS